MGQDLTWQHVRQSLAVWLGLMRAMVGTVCSAGCFLTAADRVEDRLTPVSVGQVDAVAMAQVVEVAVVVRQVGQVVPVVTG
jgi:hypothetical protein